MTETLAGMGSLKKTVQKSHTPAEAEQETSNGSRALDEAALTGHAGWSR